MENIIKKVLEQRNNIEGMDVETLEVYKSRIEEQIEIYERIAEINPMAQKVVEAFKGNIELIESKLNPQTMEAMEENEWIELNQKANEAHEQKVQEILNRKFDINEWNDEVEFELEMEVMELEMEAMEEKRSINAAIKEVKELKVDNKLSQLIGAYVKKPQEAPQEVLKGEKVMYDPNKAQALKKEINKAIRAFNKAIDLFASGKIDGVEYMEYKKNLSYARSQLKVYEVQCGVWKRCS